MARRPRSELPDGIYHVTARGVGGAFLFLDDEDRASFVRSFVEVLILFEIVCHGFCLMGTHYHLILEALRERLSLAMHRLNTIYAQRFNRRHDRRGHLFEERYSAYVIRDEDHLAEACRYVAANPVRAGLCDSINAWPWTWIASEQGGVGERAAGSAAVSGFDVPASHMPRGLSLDHVRDSRGRGTVP